MCCSAKNSRLSTSLGGAKIHFQLEILPESVKMVKKVEKNWPQFAPSPATYTPTTEHSGALGKGRMECSPSTRVTTMLLAELLCQGERVEEKTFFQISDLYEYKAWSTDEWSNQL